MQYEFLNNKHIFNFIKNLLNAISIKYSLTHISFHNYGYCFGSHVRLTCPLAWLCVPDPINTANKVLQLYSYTNSKAHSLIATRAKR